MSGGQYENNNITEEKILTAYWGKFSNFEATFENYCTSNVGESGLEKVRKTKSSHIEQKTWELFAVVVFIPVLYALDRNFLGILLF